MASGRMFQHRNRSQRRLTAWSRGPLAALAAASSTFSALWSNGASATIDGITLVRIRGEFLAYLATASAEGAGFTGAVGIVNVTNEAFAAGVGSIPTPLADDGFDGWIWHNYFILSASAVIDGTASTDSNLPGTAMVRIPIDSKAMRKTPEGTTLVGVIEATEIGTATMSFLARTRILDKLP